MSWLKSFFGTGKTQSSGNATAIDAVIFLTSLASRPQEIDPMLDKMRTVTAMQKPGIVLSEKDQLILATIYTNLEQYLIKKEPVRAFTKEELIKKVRARVKPQGKIDAIFWERISNATS